MKKEVNSEVYRFYKNQYPLGVILFHVGNRRYESYNDDAPIVKNVASYKADLFHPDYRDGICSLEGDSDLLLPSFIQECKNSNIPVHIVSYIDSDGNFCLPKVNQILQDMEDDY